MTQPIITYNKCKKELPESAFTFVQATGKYRRACNACREEKAYTEPLPPKYGTKSEQIKKVLEQREKVLQSRLKSLTTVLGNKEADEIIRELNSIQFKL